MPSPRAATRSPLTLPAQRTAQMRSSVSRSSLILAVGLFTMVGVAGTLHAQQAGGDGGGGPVGVGGVTDTMGNGMNGSDGASFAGGGGGGGGSAGETGGTGGSGPGDFVTSLPTLGGVGGAPATNGVGNDGSNGESDVNTNSAGAGGGGGSHGGVTDTPSGDYTGGKGGVGGSSRNGGAGGGGGGGYGVVLTGDASVDGAITGGMGGSGGDGQTGTGNGGDGGVGLLAVGDREVMVTGAVTGGDGGVGGLPNSPTSPSVDGIGGRGGVGILSYGNSEIIVFDGSFIAGGVSGDGLTRANAITMNGMTNTLRLSSEATVFGNVEANGSDDTLALFGVNAYTFDLGELGDTSTLRGFETVQFFGNDVIVDGSSSAYTGTFIASGTKLTVDGTLFTPLQFAGEILTGSGTLNSLFMDRGIISPGNGIGTLNATGDLTFGSGLQYDVEIDANGSSDLIATTGGVTLSGGEVNPITVSTVDAYAPVQIYTIVTAGNGVSGTFASVRDESVLASYTLAYGANDVTLTRTIKTAPTLPPAPPPVVDPLPPVVDPINPAPVTPPVTPPVAMPDFVGVADGPNARALAGVLGTYDFSADPALMNTLLTLSSTEINLAYASMGGEVHDEVGAAAVLSSQGFTTQLMNVARDQSQVFVGAAPRADLVSRNRVADIAEAGDIGFVLGAYGARTEVDTDGNARGFEAGAAGIYGGVQSDFGGTAVAGVAFGVGSSSVDIPEIGQTADIGNVSIGLYGAAGAAPMDAGLAVRGSLSYTQHTVDTTRNIAVGDISRTAEASYSGHTLSGDVAVAYNVDMESAFGSTILSPFVEFSAASTSFDAFTETGAGGLNISGQMQDLHTSTMALGISATGEYLMDNGVVATPTLSISLDKRLGDTTTSSDLALAGSSAGFASTGAQADDQAVRFGLSSGFAMSEGTRMAVGVDALRSDSVTTTSVGASVSFAF